MISIDTLLEHLPLIGLFFQKTYAFWRLHVGIANVTHVVFGFGLALIVASPKKGLGMVLVGIAIVMHIIAFVAGSYAAIV